VPTRPCSEAVAAANTGHALAYGNDRWTAEATARLRDLFAGDSGRAVEGAPGVERHRGQRDGARIGGCRLQERVVCSAYAHIAVDETGAPERIVGSKLIPLEAPHAKLVPAQIEELAPLRGDMPPRPAGGAVDHPVDRAGRGVYTASEVAALCDTAHRMGMVVHMDGARLANATAALGGTPAALRSMTIDAGVDVVSFGGTKAGLIGGEAVVYLDPALARRAAFVRKMTTQLPSKMRFIARPVQRPVARRAVDPPGRARQQR
jgi:threonine aldolase